MQRERVTLYLDQDVATLLAACAANPHVRQGEIVEPALLAVGVEATPSLATCGREDWLKLVARQPSTAVDAPKVSTALPSQFAA